MISGGEGQEVRHLSEGRSLQGGGGGRHFSGKHHNAAPPTRYTLRCRATSAGKLWEIRPAVCGTTAAPIKIIRQQARRAHTQRYTAAAQRCDCREIRQLRRRKGGLANREDLGPITRDKSPQAPAGEGWQCDALNWAPRSHDWKYRYLRKTSLFETMVILQEIYHLLTVDLDSMALTILLTQY